MEISDREYHKTDIHGNPLSEEEQEWCEQNEYLPESFVKRNWKTGEARDQWQELLDEATDGVREAEWLSVLDDRTDRKAAIIYINNYNREKWLKRVGEHGLHYRDIRYTEPYEGYSHKHFPTDVNDPNRLTYAVVAENADVADKIEEAELNFTGYKKHNTIGEFLDFPECCREFFVKHWSNEGHVDPMYEVSCNTPSAEPIDGDPQNVHIKDPNPWVNAMYRYWGLCFLTHIPCSWECEKSAEVARHRGEIMSENGYKDGANALYNWLNEPMVWTGKNGLAHVKNQYMIGSSGTSSYWDKKRLVWKEENEAGGAIVED